MKITIEKTETTTIREQITIPEFFTTFNGWYFRTLSDNRLFHVSSEGICIYKPEFLKHMEHLIKPCTPDEFTAAYAATLTKLQAYSGIEHLPLIDNTQNPE